MENTNISPERQKAIRAIKILLFSASVIPVLVGGAIADSINKFNLLYFILAGFGLFIGQAGGDYLYYYFTHRHTDERDSHSKIFAGWRPLFADNLPEEKGTLYAGITCLIIDLAIAVYFTYELGYGIILLALFGGLIAIFFTPLMLKGYKEPVIFVTFGPMCVFGMYYVMAVHFDWMPVVISLPIAFFVTVVAYLKGAHFEVKKEETGDVILNLNNKHIIILYVLGFFSLILPAILGFTPMASLAGLITIPVAISVVKTAKSTNQVQNYLWAVVRSLIAFDLLGIIIALSFIIKF